MVDRIPSFNSRIARVGAAVTLAALPACGFIPNEPAATPSAIVMPVATEVPPPALTPLPMATVSPTRLVVTAPPTEEPILQLPVAESAYANYLMIQEELSILKENATNRQQPLSRSELTRLHEMVLHQEVAAVKKFDKTATNLRSVDRHTVAIGADTFDLRNYGDRLYADALLSSRLRTSILPWDESRDLWLSMDRPENDALRKLETSVHFLRDKITFSEDSQWMRLTPNGFAELASTYRLLGEHGRALPKNIALIDGWDVNGEYRKNPDLQNRLEINNNGISESIGWHLIQNDPSYFKAFQEAMDQYYDQAGNAIDNYEYTQFRGGRDRLVFYRDDEQAFWSSFRVFMRDGQEYRDRVGYMGAEKNPSEPLYAAAYQVHEKRLGFETLTEGVVREPRSWRTGDNGFVFEYDGDTGVTLNKEPDSDRWSPILYAASGTPIRITGTQSVQIVHPSLPLQTADMIEVSVNGRTGYMAEAYLSPSRR